MPSFRIVLIISAIILAASVGGFVSMSQQPSESGAVLTYYDGNEKIHEQNYTGQPVLFNPENIREDCTFYGWSLKKDMSGSVMKPGTKQNLRGDCDLYAVIVDGKVSYDNGTAVFSAASIHDRPAVIDLSRVGQVKKLSIMAETIDMFAQYGVDVRIIYAGGFETVLFDDLIQSCRSVSAAGPVSISSSDVGGGKDFSIFAHSTQIEDLGRGIGVRVPMTVPVGASFTVTQPSDCCSHITYEMLDGCAVFTVTEMGYRTSLLYPVRVVDQNGGTIDTESPDYPLLTGKDSKPLGKGALLGKGDIFKIEKKAGKGYRAEGAVKDKGFYRVSTDAQVKITVFTGSMICNVNLPEDPIGYKITSETETVKEGERCTLYYKLMAGYIDVDLVITVNGISVGMDSASRIFIDDVREDLDIMVFGVYDMRVYQILVPKEQAGYSLKASADKLHHGQSYDLDFNIKDGYEKLPNFKVLLNGVVIDLTPGVKHTVKNVVGVQMLSVEGLQMKKYNVTAGSNTTLRVGGFVVTTATVDDVIEVVPNGDYEIPSTYNSHMPLSVKLTRGGYKVTGDSVFPSIVMVTVGDNVTVGNVGNGITFLCQKDNVKIRAKTGYSFPSNYADRLSNSGASCNNDSYTFSKDIDVPSIYRVTFMDKFKVFKTIYTIGKDPVPKLDSDPINRGFIFEKWDIQSNIIMRDVVIQSNWTALSFNVVLGINTSIQFKDGSVISINENSSESERKLVLSADKQFRISRLGASNVIDVADRYYDNIGDVDTWHYARGDIVFDNCCIITYLGVDYNNVKQDCFVQGHTFTLPKEIWSTEGSTFAAWKDGNRYVVSVDGLDKLSYILEEVRVPT